MGNPTAYTDRTKVFIRDQQGWSGVADPNVAGKNLAQAGYSKGPTVKDKVDAIRFDLVKDMPEGSLFASIKGGINYTRRTKDRITDEGVLQSATNNGFDPVPFPDSSYVSRNVGGTGFDMVTFDPSCEASIGCCGCSPGVVLRDWESPNPLSKQNRSPDEQP